MSADAAQRYLEVERKFDVDASTRPPSFDDVHGVARVARAETQTLDAVYFDTAERALASHRVTLRRRTGGHDAGWHLKLPAGPDARTEVRAPLAGDEPPAELLDVVLAIVRDQPVGPVARIGTTRQVTWLHGADDAVLAEFCDDQVTAGRGPDGETAQQRWREWELELVGDGASADLLDRLCDRLLGAGAKPAGHGSKLARVLDTSPTALPSDPLRRALAEQTGELLEWDRAVRAEADDAVHQMRVTARKIRSLLQASPESFGLDGSAPVIGELRELGTVLGVARDAEVLAERYRDALDAVPPELVRGPIRHRLVDGADQRYRSGLRHALAAMRLPRYFRLLDLLDALVARAPVEHSEPAQATVATVGKKVRKAAKKAEHTHAGPDRDEAIHRIRKRAKRLRYTADATGAKKVSKRAKKLQSLLGDHQDSVVSREHLAQQAEAAHAAGEDTFTYGLLYQREADLAVESRRQLEPTLTRLLKAARKL
ncbi:CYTH and CHAD domain-containing protein [Candidatus Mycobacterium wuenschmannii]|uniref:CYTH and CHAD domain-containing protein n=1 Tax=Candidatus Mycobacterium wuenschmannii TaxID=3027808 RepID=A0ABY8W031_9MYCO|nr:CYTH and CHAD domain-containing protein [Candidatus Mycobacterium wuenschmannii]WIM89250.1 CYTH and CHAD domain-containing protein [Candidatus Mycobacterium wuenschmannii]